MASVDYDRAFFEQNVQVGLAAAEIVLPDVLQRTKAHSVIDIGCGPGAWLLVAKKIDCRVRGVDGFVPIEQLLIDPNEFDLSTVYDGYVCAGYDLALCLEVAEHLPESSAPALVKGLCQSPFVLWSAAIPNQGGVGHINEQWPSWWALLFAEHGYVGSCDIREEHWNDPRVADFYRQNLMVWSSPERIAAMGYHESVIDEVHPDLAIAKGWLT